MTSPGERLLELVAEYQESKASRTDTEDIAGYVPGLNRSSFPLGREPAEIAADYEAELRSLLKP